MVSGDLVVKALTRMPDRHALIVSIDGDSEAGHDVAWLCGLNLGWLWNITDMHIRFSWIRL